MITTKTDRRLRIRKRISKKVRGTAAQPRLSVFKSNTKIYAQVIDDVAGRTLAASSSVELGTGKKNFNIEDSKKVGALIAEKCKEANIETVVFDRSGYRYHGNVKALAEGAREGGLKF